ncbi:hypothetical protein FB45DRAFT_1105712 [Roridomyces roridus]|uniref:RING-type domain-containing protein n=1 Tax=Roridomyces roridus TaxID=1738132 RepID=A0AAD7FG09_9AGAR|nr:hypothetical protein FB45DRAFT_1105712 [Roridomyces roridus]
MSTPSTTEQPQTNAAEPLNLGAMTPHAELTPAAPARERDWRADDQAAEKELSGAYDAQGQFNLARRARRADKNDCRICDEPATDPVHAQCCDAIFCREHIRDWIKGPAASPNCPACTALCVLPADALIIPPKPRYRRRPHTTAASSFAAGIVTSLDRFRGLILAALVLALLAGAVVQRYKMTGMAGMESEEGGELHYSYSPAVHSQ